MSLKFFLLSFLVFKLKNLKLFIIISYYCPFWGEYLPSSSLHPPLPALIPYPHFSVKDLVWMSRSDTWASIQMTTPLRGFSWSFSSQKPPHFPLPTTYLGSHQSVLMYRTANHYLNFFGQLFTYLLSVSCSMPPSSLPARILVLWR